MTQDVSTGDLSVHEPRMPNFSELMPKMPDLSGLMPKMPDLSALSPKVPDLTAHAFHLPDISPPNMAEYAIKAIHEEIADFEASLDSDHEIGMPVVGGPAGLCVHVREIYRYGADKLVFVGIDAEQKPVRLVQHLTQLNLLMLAAPKIGSVAVRIGFHTPAEDAPE